MHTSCASPWRKPGAAKTKGTSPWVRLLCKAIRFLPVVGTLSPALTIPPLTPRPWLYARLAPPRSAKILLAVRFTLRSNPVPCAVGPYWPSASLPWSWVLVQACAESRRGGRPNTVGTGPRSWRSGARQQPYSVGEFIRRLRRLMAHLTAEARQNRAEVLSVWGAT
jgi:hypothetical protein